MKPRRINGVICHNFFQLSGFSGSQMMRRHIQSHSPFFQHINRFSVGNNIMIKQKIKLFIRCYARNIRLQQKYFGITVGIENRNPVAHHIIGAAVIKPVQIAECVLRCKLFLPLVF